MDFTRTMAGQQCVFRAARPMKASGDEEYVFRATRPMEAGGDKAY